VAETEIKIGSPLSNFLDPDSGQAISILRSNFLYIDQIPHCSKDFPNRFKNSGYLPLGNLLLVDWFPKIVFDQKYSPKSLFAPCNFFWSILASIFSGIILHQKSDDIFYLESFVID